MLVPMAFEIDRTHHVYDMYMIYSYSTECGESNELSNIDRSHILSPRHSFTGTYSSPDTGTMYAPGTLFGVELEGSTVVFLSFHQRVGP